MNSDEMGVFRKVCQRLLTTVAVMMPKKKTQITKKTLFSEAGFEAEAVNECVRETVC